MWYVDWKRLVLISQNLYSESTYLSPKYSKPLNVFLQFQVWNFRVFFAELYFKIIDFSTFLVWIYFINFPNLHFTQRIIEFSGIFDSKIQCSSRSNKEIYTGLISIVFSNCCGLSSSPDGPPGSNNAFSPQFGPA